jgi:3-hydroxyisobutyrate dehydrogenase-like beta-hydroxyacid dehydrogenase
MNGQPITAVGLVGCGRMGSAIGTHLLAADWPLVVADPDPDASRLLTALGAVRQPSPAAVAACSDLVLVVVVDDEQVEQVVVGADGALAGATPDCVIAVCASVRPETCRRLAQAGAEQGVHVVDMALVRGERGAEEGRLALLCGGREAVIDACRPALRAFATDVCVLGDVGAGQVAKTANNILLWACLRADVEAQRLARAHGVDLRRLRDALAVGSGANRPLAEWGKHRLRWPAKDLEVARALAADAGVAVPLVDSLSALMAELSVDDLQELL